MSEDTRTVRLVVNGAPRAAEAPVRLHLGDFLRQRLGLTGTHLGCEHGACGACTVLMDGVAVRSCLTLAVQAEGREVVTIEGLARDGRLHPLQEAFRDAHALQCGFCTAGILTTLVDFLAETPDPTAEEVRLAISGNLCRCTGYEAIVGASLAAARRMREEAPA